MLEIKVNKPYPLSKMRKPSIWNSGARCQGSNTVGQLEQVTSPISTSFPFKKKRMLIALISWNYRVLRIK